MGTNTGLGIGIGIPFKNNALGGDKPYFPPELKARMIGVWTNYGKKNADADRNIIKNKIPNAGGDLEILNAAYKLNSGFGKYSEDFTTWTKSSKITSVDSESFDFVTNVNWNLLYHRANIGKDIPSFKVHIKLKGEGKVFYNYITSEGVFTNKVITSEEYVVPISYNTKYTGETPVNCGFSIGVISEECSGTITQIPNFEDAFVTDGINDMIISQKTLQEMGVTKELTIVSMIHQISWRGSASIPLTNYIRNGDTFIRNSISNIGKTGIYGYTCFNVKNVNSSASKVINNILGDKNDYIVAYRGDILSERFSVQGYIEANGNILETSSVAHYWTFAVLGKATEDEINLIIGNYNLDRSLKPDILCNIGKQGITNDNHAEFGDKLIDYSGNGRDIQLNNLAWDGDSGIGKYNYPNWKVNVTQGNKYARIVYYDSINGTYSANFKGITDLYKSYGLSIEIRVNRANTIDFHSIKEDGIYTITPPDDTTSMDIRFGGEDVYNASCNITITQIPSHAGALCLDGVNDFGQFVGDLELKDYTFIADRAYSRIAPSQVPFIASTQTNGQAPFLMEYLNEDTYVYPHSFGTTTKTTNLNIQRQISYQSTYVYNGNSISKGTSVDTGDGLTIGNSGSTGLQYSPLCLWSLMLFPYSMSEFLIERQLKKHKLGTLYPDMVEFRPVITINGESGDISYANDKWENINIGDYINIGEIVHILLYRKDIEEISNVKVNGAKFQSIDFDSIYNHWNINIELTSKSPQKIDITIDEYIRYEDIVQPYPVLLRFNDENGNEVSWGGKFRVGSTITRIGNFYENNLLDGLYVVRNPKLNGNNLINPTHVVEKSMVFTCDTEYLLDNNEPKCILSPSRLRIPNSSYKILGYIPDISGHGNHGVIHNSAYAGASGANGYLQNFSGWTKASGVSSTDSVISSSNNLVAANGWIAYVTSGTVIPTFKVEISGIPINGNLRFEGSDQTLVNGVNTIQGLTTTKVSGFYISNGYDNDWSNLRIEQIGEYEGAYCLDGVDDFVTIPTVTGGKQVLMKVNWSNNTFNEILYDQRVNLDIHTFAIFNHDSDTVTGESVVAYNSKNNGNTYIDGILNSNIKASELKDIKHNITITNELVDTNNSISPIIGTNKNRDAHYAKMALYDFMLFDSISTDDKIKELNEYIGIEAKVELPPYYWDAYGKTNLDEDKNYTANLGTVKDVIEVSQPAIFAENWYDGNPEPVLSSPIINQTDYSIEVKANKMDNNFTMMLDVECDTPLPAFKAKFSMVGTAISVDLKYYINGGSKIIDVFKSGGSTEPVILDIPASERSFIYGTNTDNYPNILIEILPADNGTRYGLTNTNFAYDKMSGYGGYNLSRFDKSWSSSSNTSIKVVQRNPYDITLKKLGGNSDWEFNNTELKVISNPVSVKFKSNKNIRVTCDYHYYPVGGNSEGTPLGITSKDLIANEDTVITISPISQENIDKYNIDVNRGYYLIYFQLSSTLAVDEEVTIEMLPLYPNGLVYDGITDYSENANIPAFTEFSYVFKRKLLSESTRSASMNKGLTDQQRAVVVDHINANGNIEGTSFGTIIPVSSLRDSDIIYSTTNNINGTTVSKGSKPDSNGIDIGRFVTWYKQMVFYKLMLYPKTIPLLQINFLKNLMEKDEIIDLNNPIFIKNE